MNWPTGAGEMAERIRTHNWSATPIGSAEGWPSSLRTVVDILLTSGFAMVALWGAELTQIYNDRYRDLMGVKHPGGLGQPTRECWPEVWHINAPIYDRVWRGETLTFEDALYPVTRSGRLENAWFSLAYSPLKDDDTIVGVLVTVIESTRAVQARGRLQDSEARFRAYVTASSDVVYRMSPDWSVMQQLDGATFLATTREPSRDWLMAYIPCDEQDRVLARIDAAIRTRTVFELEHKVLRSDGTVGWTLSRATPILDSTGTITEWLGSAKDVTDRRQVEDALRRSEHLRRIAMDSGGMGAWRWNLADRLIWGDARFLALWGYPPSDGPHRLKLFTDRMSPEGAAEMEVIVTRAIEAGEGFDGQLEIVSGPTAGSWVRWRGRADDAESRTIYGVSFDVTDQRHAASALQESEERLRRFGEASQDILWIRDADTLQWTYLTPAFEAIYGLSRDDALKGDNYRSWQDLIVPEDRTHAISSIARVRAGEHVTFEYRVRRPFDGNLRWLRNTDFPMLDDTGRVARIGGIGHDVTALKAIEAALKHSEGRLRTLVEGVSQLVWRAINSGDWIWASPQWTAFTGQDEVDSHGHGWLNPVHPDDRKIALGAWDRVHASDGLQAEYRILHAATGAYRWFQTRAAPQRDARGRIVEWLGTSTDVHQLKALQQSQAVMVNELQHRTRNLIAVVRGIADDTMEHTGPGENFRAAFSDRLTALSRVQGLLSRAEVEPITIAALVRLELDALGAVAAGGRVTVEGPDISLRPSTVQTLALALHELATNARKYGALSHKNGHLSVTWSERVENGEHRCLLDWTETELEKVPTRLHPVSDSGGYGRELIEQALPHALGARTSYVLDGMGVHCTIDLPARPDLREMGIS